MMINKENMIQQHSNHLGKHSVLGILSITILLLIWGCDQQAVGFSLPMGNAEDGKVVFTDLACNQCHSVEGIGWAGTEGIDFHLQLGGQVARVRTYGGLVTSIINPSHKISSEFRGEIPRSKTQSPMPSYNQVLTVQELIDLVTFLQETYELKPPPTHYTVW